MKNLLTFLCFFTLSISVFSQEKPKDSTAAQKLDEVLVNSVRVSADAPVTHSNLSKKELEKRNLGQDIPVLLNYLPNVVTTTDAGAGVGYTGMRVRGTDSRGINVTINGIPYNDTESQGTFWVNMPDFSSSVENIQLQRGVGTSTNGAGAFGASLNILTDVVQDSASAEIANSFGSFGTRKHNAKFSTGKLNNHFELSGRLSKIKSDGYVDRASSDLDSYFLQGTYVGEKTLIKALAFGGHEVTYQSWNGIDRDKLNTDRTYNSAGEYTDVNGLTQYYDKEEDNYKQDHYQLHWTQKIGANWTTTVGSNYTWGRGYYEQYKNNQDFADYNLTDVVIGGTTVDATDLVRRKWLDNDYFVLNANANYKKDNLDIVFGGSGSYYEGTHFGEIIWARNASDSELRDRYYDNTSYKSDVNFFTKANIKLNNKFLVYGDLQVRTINYNSRTLNVDDSFTFFNPKVGLTYMINDQNNVYASFARANREPNRGDYKNGNPEPEQLNDFELGWRFVKEKATINANFYYMGYKDQLVNTGELDLVGAPIRTNSGKSLRVGVEIDANIKVLKKLSVLPNISVSMNKNKDFIASTSTDLENLGNTNISYSPSIVAGNAIVFRPINSLQLSLLSKFVGEQYMNNIDDDNSKLADYFVNDFNVSYELKTKKIFKSILFTGLVSNIFNREYVSNGADYGWGYIYYYPQATTNFLIGATLKF
jgi:iron complex outermembrane receptor protein